MLHAWIDAPRLLSDGRETFSAEPMIRACGLAQGDVSRASAANAKVEGLRPPPLRRRGPLTSQLFPQGLPLHHENEAAPVEGMAGTG